MEAFVWLFGLSICRLCQNGVLASMPADTDSLVIHCVDKMWPTWWSCEVNMLFGIYVGSRKIASFFVLGSVEDWLHN